MISDPAREASGRSDRVSVLFVCLGNICRSPTAEGIFRRDVELAGLADRVRIDSAGTGSWHAGQPPDERSRRESLRRGIDIGAQRARQASRGDFLDFDLLIAMDRSNRQRLEQMRPALFAGKAPMAEVRLMLEFAPRLRGEGVLDVPDPYEGGLEGFERVFDMIEEASAGLLGHVRARLAPPGGPA